MDWLEQRKILIKSLTRRYGYLSVLLISYGIMALSTVLFESVSVESVDYFEKILDGEFQPIDKSGSDGKAFFIEIRARYFWLASALMGIGISLYVSIIGVLVISQCHQGIRMQFICTLTIVLCLLNLGLLQYTAESKGAMYRLIYGPTVWCLTNSERYSEEFLYSVGNIIAAVNISSSIAPVIVALAFSSTVSPSNASDSGLSDLSLLPSRMRFLKSTLKLAAALLVIGILHMNAWLQWPTALIREEALKMEYSRAALSVSVYWGATFTLMLFLTYGPAASYLSLHARKIIEPRLDDAEKIEDRQKWLKDHDLSFSFGDQVPQFMIMLSPLLAGPLQFFLMHTANQ